MVMGVTNFYITRLDRIPVRCQVCRFGTKILLEQRSYSNRNQAAAEENQLIIEFCGSLGKCTTTVELDAGYRT